MVGKILLTQCVVLVLWSTIASLASAEMMICHPEEFSVILENGQTVNYENSVLTFEYNRNSLAVYQYPGTPSVNLDLKQSRVTFTGNANYPEYTLSNRNIIQTSTIGLANTVNTNANRKALKDCTFYVSKKRGTRATLPNSLVDKILDVATECIETKLCQNLRVVGSNDLTLAEKTPRDFGPMDIRSRSLHLIFPKMISPKAHQAPQVIPLQQTAPVQKKTANILDGVDSIISGVAHEYKYRNGYINIPNIRTPLGRASRGIFGDLSALRRVDSSRSFARESPNSEKIKSVSFQFGVPKGHVLYKDYKVLQIVPFGANRELSGNVENVIFSAEIAIDFRQRVCSTSLKSFKISNKGDATLALSGGYIPLSNMLSFFINGWNDNVVDEVKNNVEYTMRNYLAKGDFNCETYRP